VGLVAPQLIGRFGNQLFQYAFARAYAEKHGHEFCCPHWIGDDLFELNDRRQDVDLLGCPEGELTGQGDVQIQGYAQNQTCIDQFSKKQVQRWFRFRPYVTGLLESRLPEPPNSVAHRRVGDYIDLGYVVVSRESYLRAHNDFGFGSQGFGLHFVEEEKPTRVPPLPHFMGDFYLMLSAQVLFRGNSSFSWWAATLGKALVFSPVITGKAGGREHDCQFIGGNHPKFADLPFVTDLMLRDE
jgi:hypothetical protein